MAWVLQLVLLRLLSPECCPMLWGHTGIFTSLGYLGLCFIFMYSTYVWSTCEDFWDVDLLPLFHYHLHIIAKEWSMPKIWQVWIFSIPCSSSYLFHATASITLCSKGPASFLLSFLLENVLSRYLNYINLSSGFILLPYTDA